MASVSGSKVTAQVVILSQQREESEEHAATLLKRREKLEVARIPVPSGQQFDGHSPHGEAGGCRWKCRVRCLLLKGRNSERNLENR